MYYNEFLKLIFFYAISYFCFSRCSVLESMDILFVVDDCVLPDVYKHKLNTMLISMVDKALETDSNSKTGFVFYSDQPTILWNFNDPPATSRDHAVKLISDKVSSSESKKSCLAGGILEAYNIFKNLQNSERTKILIVVSHQVENCGHHDHVLKITKNLTSNKVHVVSIAIGKDANTEIMEQIASTPKLYYHMVDYSQAENMIHVVMEKLSILGGTYVPIPPVDGLDSTFIDQQFVKSVKSDLQILVDSSNYVPDDLFELFKKSVHQILSNFHADGDERRSSLTFFNAMPHQLWNLESEESTNYVKNKNKLLSYRRPQTGGGDICISMAFNHTMKELYEKNNDINIDNKKIVLLITTGENTCSPNNQAWLQAARLKSFGATNIVVGVGPAGICDSLVGLASGGINYIHITDVVDMATYVRKTVDQILTFSTNGIKILKKKNQQKRDQILENGPNTEEIKKQMELRYLILINTAGIVSDQTFLMTKSVTTQLIEKLKSDVVKYKIVVATFSNTANLLWNFENPTFVTDQDAAINQVNLLTKDSNDEVCVAGALKSVLNDAFLSHETYKYTAKYLFFVSGSNQKCPESTSNDLLDVANLYSEHNIITMSIGIGVGISSEEFKIISSEGYGYVEMADTSSEAVGVESIIQLQLTYQAKYKQIIQKISTGITITEEDKKFITETVKKEVEVREKYEHKEYVPNSGFDIAIVIESSCHIDGESFNAIKTATIEFMKKFYTEHHGTKFSFATYSNSFSPSYYFNYDASFKIEDAISSLESVTVNSGCQSCLSVALKNTHESLFNPGFERPNVPKVAITISFSSEQCNGIQGIRYYASKIKTTGIQMFSIALGGKTVLGEVELAGTTSQKDHYIFLHNSYLEITHIYEKLYVIITQKHFDKYVPQPGDDIKPTINEDLGVATKAFVDIVVIMDVSEQTTDADLELMKLTLLTMYKKLMMGGKAIKIALITVSNEATIHWVYSYGVESVDANAVEVKLVTLTISRSPQSCIYKGFHEGASKILGFTEARPGSYKIFIYFGSGETNCDYEYLITTANYAKSSEMTIVTVGFGSNINEKNMIEIASSSGNYFKSEDIMILIDILNRLADDQVEIRIDHEKYVINSQFLINTYKKKTVIVEETITREVEILTKTVIDLVIVFHAKGPEAELQESIQCFIKTLYEFLLPKKDKIQISLIVYGSQAKIVWSLNSEEAFNINMALDLLKKETFPIGDENVCSENAFELITTSILKNQIREMSKKVVLHITDYKSNCGDRSVIFQSMKEIKLSRILFFSVGISHKVQRSLIELIASVKSTEFFFASFFELCQMAGRLGKLIKDISVTNVKTSTDVVSKNNVIYINDLKLKLEDEIPEEATTTSTTSSPPSKPDPEVVTSPPPTTPRTPPPLPPLPPPPPSLIDPELELVKGSTSTIPPPPPPPLPPPPSPPPPPPINPELEVVTGPPPTTPRTPPPPPPVDPKPEVVTSPPPTKNKSISNFYSINNKNSQAQNIGDINIHLPKNSQLSGGGSIQHIHNINNTVQVAGSREETNGSDFRPIFNPIFKPEIHVHGNENGDSNVNRPMPTHIKINFCEDSKFKNLGCVNDFANDFPFQIGGDVCQKQCNMTLPEIQRLACNCASETQRRHLTSFGITNRGSCYGSNLNHGQMLFVPNKYCETNHRERCTSKRTLCIGGQNSLYAFELDE